MKKLNITVFLVICGFILLILGIIFQHNTSKQLSSQNNKNSIKIYKKHCLDGICIDSMKIGTEVDNSVYITGIMINETIEELPQGFINIVFILNDEEIIQPYFYCYTSSIKQYNLEIPSVNKKILNAIDYKIETPTEEQLQYYYDNLLSLD